MVSDQYLADPSPPLAQLAIGPHFDALTSKEKLYAHHLSRACFHGTRIILRQLSAESEQIFDMLTHLFASQQFDQIKKDTKLDDEAWNQLLAWSAMFLSNLGNYKSFGDTKFIPRLSKEQFVQAFSSQPKAKEIVHQVVDKIYATEEGQLLLGYTDKGHISAYYPGKPTSEADINAVQRVLEQHNVSPLNTRLAKEGDNKFTLLVASAEKTPSRVLSGNGLEVTVQYGDYADAMQRICDELALALPHVANEHQKTMVEHYITSFKNGSIESHRDSQRAWIKDKGPNVESNIGFIETYRDPAGIRAEWEGFVSMVNKERTKVFGEMYDDIRQTEGFKNVSLGNVLNAKAANEPVTFLSESDVALWDKYRGPAFEVQVGIHELLGHGTGKLLMEIKPGEFNFDKDTIDPTTGKAVQSWYKVGETWGGQFGAIAASYEECRAECVAMYLCTEPKMLEIFGHKEHQEAEDVLYVAYLQMARAGLLALEFWDPKTTKWGQAHMMARYAILQCFLEAGQDFVKIEAKEDDLLLTLDRSKIRSFGKKAVGDFLCKLHVYKSSANVKAGSEMYLHMTTVNALMAKYRDIVLKKRLPRKVMVQANTMLAADKKTVELKEYTPSFEGLISSWVERRV